MTADDKQLILGQMAAFPEKIACYCGDPKPHWHAIDMVWNGKRWVDVNSQNGIDLMKDFSR